MGFDDEGIVALSGAHTLGRAQKVRSALLSWGFIALRDDDYVPYQKFGTFRPLELRL